MKRDPYPGIHKDVYGGMNDVGRIIRDAWVFGILPESEGCEGWDKGRIQELYDKVYEAWEPYGHMVNALPPELLEKHQRIYKEAFENARRQGWSVDMNDDED